MKVLTPKACFGLLSVILLPLFTIHASAHLIVTACDSTIQVQDGEIIIDPEGERSISIIDLKGPAPVIRATIPLGNSLFGPPVNIGITPNESLALVSEALKVSETEEGPQLVPSNIVHVVDLQTDPPQEIGQVTVGSQPSGMSIHPKGHMALVANVGDNSISVLSIKGKEVTPVGKVDMGGSITHVVFTPDGKRALATKFTDHMVAVLTIDGMNVTYTGQDLPVGLYPFNMDITPDGSLAIVANTGKNGRSDGNVNTVTMIDLEPDPMRVIDHLPVGDAPEGIAISPTGEIAVVGLLDGGDAPSDAFYYNKRGRIVVLAIEDKKVRRLEEIRLGGIPESLAFSPDGKLLLVGNLLDKDISVLQVEGTKVTDTKANLLLTAQPGAMRAKTR